MIQAVTYNQSKAAAFLIKIGNLFIIIWRQDYVEILIGNYYHVTCRCSDYVSSYYI